MCAPAPRKESLRAAGAPGPGLTPGLYPATTLPLPPHPVVPCPLPGPLPARAPCCPSHQAFDDRPQRAVPGSQLSLLVGLQQELVTRDRANLGGGGATGNSGESHERQGSRAGHPCPTRKARHGVGRSFGGGSGGAWGGLGGHSRAGRCGG